MACLWPDRSWAPPAATNIVWATSELHGWLADQRDYEWRHKQGYLSALADFKFSVTQLEAHSLVPRSAMSSPQH